MNRLMTGIGGAVASCLCLAAVGVWHSNITPSPAAGEQTSSADMPDNTTNSHIDSDIGNEGNIGNMGNADTTVWLSADELLRPAENDTQMGVAVPIFVAYQGAIYGGTGEEHNKNSQYAISETEVIFNKNYSYPAYQVRNVSDSVAIIINGRLTTYQKLFEINAVVDGTPYKVVHPMGFGSGYSYGEIIQENEDFTIYQAIKTQSGEVTESEYVINILPLLKRELPNLFGGDENYGDAWWVAIPQSNE